MKTLLILLSLLVHVSLISQSNVCACCTEDYKKFDFWSGDWQVSSNGQIAGSNHIYYTQDSCILLENWVGAGGITGTSMNYFDKNDKTWNQLWIDNSGNALKLKGQHNGESMILVSEPAISNNQVVINKITWTPQSDGSVRQLWESTNNAGIKWNILFEGIYRKK